MKLALLSAVAAVALLAGRPACALSPPPAGIQGATTPVVARITDGPWALAEGPATATSPYTGYCNAQGVQVRSNGTYPMQPYYFPHIQGVGPYLQGWFDYRPRNAQEAVVAAVSQDRGKTWVFQQQAAGLDIACPASVTDPDNVNIYVGTGAAVPNQVFDNGQGHPFVTQVKGKRFLYTLDRSNNNIDVVQLIVHQLVPNVPPLPGLFPLRGVAQVESVGTDGVTGSLGAQGLVPPANPFLRTTGLLNPDAILGVLESKDSYTTILYVSKVPGGDKTGATALPPAQQCGKTPSFAVSPGRAANHDYVTQRVASTTDGISFTDLGVVSGLGDPTTTSYHGIRYLGSGSVFPLAGGRHGLLFGAGNCLDGDSDGFHFVGYAETTTPGDLFHWQVLNGLDNPVISTGQITDPATSTVYPANTPVADATDWPTPAATNFYYGRAYGPTVAYAGPRALTVIFAGYNTPQPKNNLGNYRSIGVTTVTLPRSSIVSPF